MSRFFPQAAYAEDQPLGRTILAVHVVTRGATTGAIVGGALFTARSTIQRLRRSSPPTISFLTRPQLFLHAAGTGTAVGAVLLGGALGARMWGREGIEWQDRSWRLLRNKGQVECDDFTYGGAVGGVGAAAVTGALRGVGWRGAVGAAGVGSVVGTVGYMAWRYGVKGGRFEE